MAAFFRAFVLSCFRDPLADFMIRELNAKADHESSKTRKDAKDDAAAVQFAFGVGIPNVSQSKSVEVDRTRTNSNTAKMSEE